ncbi:MAG: hypothetical protein ACYS8W_16310, partial [Planctomycetota bacterium]
MPKKKDIAPDPIKKRDLLYSDDSEEPKDSIIECAEALLERGETHDAVAFFIKAGAGKRLEDLLADAVVTGDFPTMYSIWRGGIEVAAEKWKRCAEAARGGGKLR